MVEPWLRGTLEEVDPVRRGVLHALELAAEDAARWCAGLTEEEMEARPYGVASVGFHLRHMARSLDRLLTYAEGSGLTAAQLEKLGTEMEPGGREATLMEFAEGMEVAVARVRRFLASSYARAAGGGTAGAADDGWRVAGALRGAYAAACGADGDDGKGGGRDAMREYRIHRVIRVLL